MEDHDIDKKCARPLQASFLKSQVKGLNREIIRRRYCSMASFAGWSPTLGGRLVADACDQQPFEPEELGPRER